MPRPGDEPVELEAVVLAIGENAARLDFGKKVAWIPYSALHEDNEWDNELAEVGDSVTIIVKQWLAEKEGLV